MRNVQELLDILVPFVVLPFEGVGKEVPKSARELAYLHELDLEELKLEEVVTIDRG